MQSKSPRGVQQQEVAAAADALLAEGARPTVERVRLKLGRGSPNTVGPMLETWFAGLAPRLGLTDVEAGAPAGPPAAVRQGMQQLWEEALRLARSEANAALEGDRQALAGEREHLAVTRAELAHQLSSAELRANTLQESLQRATSMVDEGAARLRDTQAVLQQRDRELAEARASIAALVQQKDAAAREHLQQLDRLNAERTQAAERATSTERRLLEEIDRARQEAKVALKKVGELESRLAVSQDELQRAKEKASEAVHQLQLECAQLRERVAQKGEPGTRKPLAAKRSAAPTRARPPATRARR